MSLSRQLRRPIVTSIAHLENFTLDKRCWLVIWGKVQSGWISAIVKNQIGALTYMDQVSGGQKWRRHIDHTFDGGNFLEKPADSRIWYSQIRTVCCVSLRWVYPSHCNLKEYLRHWLKKPHLFLSSHHHSFISYFGKPPDYFTVKHWPLRHNWGGRNAVCVAVIEL